MKKLLLAFAATLTLSTSAFAQMVYKAPPISFVNQTCTTSNCSGFYGGLSLYGEGGNANVIGNGINGSVFAGGGMIGANVGWQLWNGSWFAALQGDGLFESAPSSTTTGFVPGGFVGMLHAKVGGNAAALFNISPTAPAPSQGPISIPAQLLSSLMSPYVDLGCIAFRKNTTQWCSGAGAQFNIGNRWTADIVYDYGAPTTKVNALQTVGIQADYHF